MPEYCPQIRYHLLLLPTFTAMPVTIADIAPLLKRLEILKNAIALQDVEDINIQSAKIEKLTASFTDLDIILEAGWILERVNKMAYGDAMQQISVLLYRFTSVALWANPEVQGLQAEINLLATQINSLESEIGDIEKVIHEFDQRNTLELGEIAIKILTFKRRRAASKAQQLQSDSEAQHEYQRAQNEEQQYIGNYEQILANPIRQLSEEHLKELKTKFKKIAKLTHPDLVDKRYEKDAAELFRRAKLAKDTNDLEAIQEIFDYLETGKPFTLRHENLTETESLRTEAKYLHNVIAQLSLKITDLKSSQSYHTISQISDLDRYFNELKVRLAIELEYIERMAA